MKRTTHTANRESASRDACATGEIKTHHFTESEFDELLRTKPKRKCVGKFEKEKLHAEEIILVRAKTIWDARLIGLRMAFSLAKTSKTMFLNRSGSKNDLADTMQLLRKSEKKHRFELRQFHSREVSEELQSIEEYIVKTKIETLVLSDLETAVDTARHKSDVVKKLIELAKSRGLCVIVITRDQRKHIAAGKYASGALGMLAGMATRIIDVKETPRPVMKKRKEKPPVRWMDHIDAITCKKCLGKRIYEIAPKSDFPKYIKHLTKKVNDFQHGRLLIKGIHDVYELDEAKKRTQEIIDDNWIEINEMKKRV